MKKKISSGQKIVRRFTFFSKKAGEATIEHVEENVIDRFSHIQNVRLLILEWSLLVAAIIFLSITQAYWYSDSYATEAYEDGGTYTEATLGEVKTLNPLFASTSSEKTISKLLFSTLSAPDYSGHYGLALAKSIKTDESAKKWTVKLRDNLKWSDGEPLTNEDVIFTVNLIKNPLVNSNFSSNLAGVSVSESEDKSAIIFNLTSANVFFEAALDFPILPKHILEDAKPDLILEHKFSSNPVSSGPYKYNNTQAIGNLGEKSVYLRANENYYKGTPKIDSFIVHAFTKTEDIVAALNAGTVTGTGELVDEDVTKVNKSNLSERESALSYGTYAFFNLERVKDKDFRKAIRQGIDFNNVRSVLDGERPLDFPVLDSQITLSKYPELPKTDKNTAKKTIKEILDSNEELKKKGLTIITVQSGHLPEVTEKLAEEIRSLGIEVRVTPYELGQDFILNILTQRNYDILVYEIGLGADPDLFAYYHSSEATASGHNLSNYKNTIVSDLVLSARSTTDKELLVKKYEKFLEYFTEDVPAIGLYQASMTYFANKNVKTYSQENHLVTSTDRLLDVERWGVQKTTKNRTP